MDPVSRMTEQGEVLLCLPYSAAMLERAVIGKVTLCNFRFKYPGSVSTDDTTVVAIGI